MPFVAMGLYDGAMVLAGVEVCHLMQHNPEEKIRVEVAVDADFVEWMTLLRPAVVAQLGVAFTSDVQVDAVLLDKVENGVYCIGGQIIAKGAFVFFNSSGVHR